MIEYKFYSIGYGGRSIEKFLDLLEERNISLLIDIRTNPQSRFQPAFNRKKLSSTLAQLDIDYLFKGDCLGGKPKNEMYYTDGEVDYNKIASCDYYQRAIFELIEIGKSHRSICLMCCELKPNDCHRKTLVGESLFKEGIITKHIDEGGADRSHDTYTLQSFL